MNDKKAIESMLWLASMACFGAAISCIVFSAVVPLTSGLEIDQRLVQMKDGGVFFKEYGATLLHGIFAALITFGLGRLFWFLMKRTKR